MQRVEIGFCRSILQKETGTTRTSDPNPKEMAVV